jgi:hypothetical protein
MAQAGRSRVRFPMSSLDSSIDLIHPAATMTLGSAQPLTEMNTRDLRGGKRRLARRKCASLDVLQLYGPLRPFAGSFFGKISSICNTNSCIDWDSISLWHYSSNMCMSDRPRDQFDRPLLIFRRIWASSHVRNMRKLCVWSHPAYWPLHMWESQ